MRKWVDQLNADLPPRAKGLVRYEIDLTDRAITLFECRPPWRDDTGPEWTRFPICRFRYTKVRGEWSLYWRDRNRRFHKYDLAHPTPLIDLLVAKVEQDPTGIFWG
ncbi:MAG: DUF3024 domain-containing protein [bacterium]|nr:DUF3024 domain-containing protein [bacterium]MDE0601194.1 DUF3024 domain-containing protein [bacterium]